MTIHLHAEDIIDPETEAHYSFKTIRPLEDSHGRIATTIYHNHDFYEVFLITHGRIWHLVNDEDILLPAGSLVFIRPNDCHSFRQYKGEDCGLINIAFPAGTITDLFTYLGDGFQGSRLLESNLPRTVMLNDTERKRAIAQLKKLHTVPHRNKPLVRTRLRLVLADLLGRYFGETVMPNSLVSQGWFKELCVQMQEPANFCGGVPAMQRLSHTSREHLSRTVRKELGCTPTQYVNDLRLTYAANLLFHTDQSIIDVSHEIGLTNLSYFYRLFKRKFGVTPAQFRSQNRKRPIP